MADVEKLPSGEKKRDAVRWMFDRIAPRYDLVNRVMTFGMDVGWRRRAVGWLGLPPDSLVLDVACGTGDFCRELERQGHRAVGIDFAAGMLQRAHTRFPMAQADALKLPFKEAVFDGATCGFALRNVIDIDLLFSEMARVVRAQGRIALLEVAQPDSRLLRFGHRIYFQRVVPVIGGVLSDREAYRYLPASAAYMPSKAGLVEALGRAGFHAADVQLLGLGAAQVVTATRT